MKENKHERFKRVASKRMQNVLKEMSMVKLMDLLHEKSQIDFMLAAAPITIKIKKSIL